MMRSYDVYTDITGKPLCSFLRQWASCAAEVILLLLEIMDKPCINYFSLDPKLLVYDYIGKESFSSQFLRPVILAQSITFEGELINSSN